MSADTVEAAGTVLLNPVVKNLTALAARAWNKGWMITFTAPTGIGKTTAVNYAARRTNRRAAPIPQRRMFSHEE